jgi:hypothetical protein
MKSRLSVLLMAALGLSGIVFTAAAEESFYEETFSLYGYVVNFFNANLYSDDWRITDSDYGNILYGRLKGDWNPGDNLSFHAELSYQGSVGNQNVGLIYEDYGVADADPSIYGSVQIDHFWGSVNLGRFDVQFGKLPIAWGTAYFFNPTAKVAVAPFLETIAEETPGTMGVVPSVSFLDGLLSLQGYIAFEDKSHFPIALQQERGWEYLPFGLKLQSIIGSFDLSASWIKEVAITQLNGYKRNHYAGLDIVGAVWNFGVYAEAAVLLWDEANKRFVFRDDPLWDLVEMSIGLDYFIPFLEIDTRFEYFHYGPGEKNKSGYDVRKLILGDQMVLAEDYLLLYMERNFLDYFSINAAGIVNVNDGSFIVAPEVSGQPFNNLDVALGAILFYGSTGSEYNGEFSYDALDSIIPAAGDLDFTESSVYLRCKLSF